MYPPYPLPVGVTQHISRVRLTGRDSFTTPSTTFHRSGRNDHDADRRAWLCTFSPAQIELKEGTTRQNVPVHRQRRGSPEPPLPRL
jgi:hypothetical protein